MKEFVKIFIGISSLAAAFLIGRSHGEKTYIESSTYRDVVRASEEMSYSKNELENIKTKLQNIADQAQNKKTDELLGDILNVFLVDLGMQLQNKEAILKQAQNCSATSVAQAKPTQVEKTEKPTTKTQDQEKPEKWSAHKLNKFKSTEWMIQNSSGTKNALNELKKVQIKNMNSFLRQAETSEGGECGALKGTYKGSIKNIENKYFGSLEFELKQKETESGEAIVGKTAWYNNNKVVSEKIKNNCGKKVKGLRGRVFGVADDKYVQVYKLNSADKIAGNFYEVLPNGTTKIVGSFILNRTDKF